MQRILLATAAAAALAFPAVAQQSNQGGMPQSGQGMTQSQSGQQQQRISASNLNESQIRQIQQALNQKGFSSGSVDGVWGPETQSALRNFQQAQNMSASGELDMQTVSALGLNASQFASGTSGSTTGSGNGSQGAPSGAGSQNGSGMGSGSGAGSGTGAGSGGAGSGQGGSR